jgi:hypothetical protein
MSIAIVVVSGVTRTYASGSTLAVNGALSGTPTGGALDLSNLTLTIPGGVTIGAKTLTMSASLTFAGTDGSTLNVGTGGTLGTAAYTAASTYATALIPINAQTGTTYTLVIGDASTLVTMSNASANTLTVPTNASVAFSVGTQIPVSQKGAGQTTIAAAGGVTINSAGGLLNIGAQYATVALVKIATDTWLLTGNLA